MTEKRDLKMELVVELMADLRIKGRVDLKSIYDAIDYKKHMSFPEWVGVATMDLKGGVDYGFTMGEAATSVWITSLAAKSALMSDRLEIGYTVRRYFLSVEEHALDMANELYSKRQKKGKKKNENLA